MFARATATLAVIFVTQGCGGTVDIGSNVIWMTGHETGDLEDWSRDGAGGIAVIPVAAATVEVSSGIAHGGLFSAHLTTPATGTETSGGLWRQGDWPQAYFSAWYLIPRAPQTMSYWTIASFEAAEQSADVAPTALIDLNLRSLPGGELVLYVLDARPQYLLWPISVPTPLVPVGVWFHLEAFYRNTLSDDGRITVWLDGRRVYDISGRPTNTGPHLRWGLKNAGQQLTPSPVELFVDDAVISLSRAGPH